MAADQPWGASTVALNLLLDEATKLALDSTTEPVPGTDGYVRDYYRFVSPADLLSRDPVDVAGAALSHLELAHRRTEGTALVRVISPVKDTDGWESPHSIVEVVTDDMPFLVDTVSAELTRHDLAIHLAVHPMMLVRRDAVGQLQAVVGSAGLQDVPGTARESFIHFEIDRLKDQAAAEALRNDIRRVLEDVRATVEDWDRMSARLREAAAAVDGRTLEGKELRAFSEWLLSESFTFLGYRDYELTGPPEDQSLTSIPGTGLGILRDSGLQPVSHSFAKLPAEVRRRSLDPTLLTITKANSRATVHRPSYLDYIGIKRLGPEGLPVGERRFLGLFTRASYSTPVAELPIVRFKVLHVLEQSGFLPGSHDHRALLAVMEDYPRDELFQISTDLLLQHAMGILYLQERRDVRVFVRLDDYSRFVSCLVYLPRERYTTANRKRILQVLQDTYEGTSVDYTAKVSESVLARLHVVVRTTTGHTTEVDVAALEQALEAATRSWTDELSDALTDAVGIGPAAALMREYGTAFPEAYKEDFPASVGVADLCRLDALGDQEGLDLLLYRPDGAAPGEQRFKIFRVGPPLTLSQVMPVLRDMGVEVSDERPYTLERPGVPDAWIYDFGLQSDPDVPLEELREAFEDAFAATWSGLAESDALNTLVLEGGLQWHEIVILRAYGKYLRQIGSNFSESYVAETLVRNPDVSEQLVRLFTARFAPGNDHDESVVASKIAAELDEVASLDEDRILRSFLALIQATVRTSYYQPDRDFLSFKIDPSAVPDLPLPRPKFEIFVYSPRVEGIHLRFGAVARGGLRWSDRREDFRTEVLGLVKAQMVKNAVIVPVGSKGGFVVKRPADPADREAWLAEGIACYSTFIRGMLAITDNIIDGTVVPPADLVRHDGDDPYLVVAADKGTATFSDIANGIALELGFWLGDAFASGGSAGYDHKVMGITARGAWEAVKRHFRELGVNVQVEPFTVVGVGDMSGDVFGNGMLLSEQIRLLAAFDHRHIFLDPNPDPAVSFGERQRLFALPRSSWADYDASLLSAGGGVFPRTAKSIPLTAEVQAALGVTASALTPAELMRAILLAPVDLLWNGGIGTYVKATSETHLEVGDKANDAVRVNGAELRCKVVGEGGNLGLTQRGRVEFALAGGHVNTDAIDNSAGVDTSDHEVNIKILLGAAIVAGKLTVEQRDELLAQMTDEVAQLVLRDNYEQNVALGNSRAQSLSMLPVHRRYLTYLEQTGRIDRFLEFLPDDATLEARAASGVGLTGPELAVLLAWTKIALTEEVLDSDVPEDPYLGHELEHYFPTPLRERFQAEMASHRLRREIIATSLVNHMVNQAGITFVYRLAEELATPVPDVVRAHTAAAQIFRLPVWWGQIEALDNLVPTDAQTAMLLEGRRLVERATRWLLTNRRQPLDIAATIRAFEPGVTAVTTQIPSLLAAEAATVVEEITARYTALGVPAEVASWAACFPAAFGTLDIVEVASTTGLPVGDVAGLYYALDDVLELGAMRTRIGNLPRSDRWQTLARSALRDDLYDAQAALATEILRTTEPGDPATRIKAWSQRQAAALARAGAVLADLTAGDIYDVTTLSVALRQIRGLTQTSTTGEQ